MLWDTHLTWLWVKSYTVESVPQDYKQPKSEGYALPPSPAPSREIDVCMLCAKSL